MAKRLGLAIVTAVVLTAISAAVAPAHTQRYKTNVKTAFIDNGMGGGSFPIDLESSYQYCEAGRVVKFFKDGVQIDKAQTDRYGMTSFGGATLAAGSYQIKAPRKRLPRALQHKPGKRHKRICKAGASAVFPVS
jgi:hypothetical protein